MSALRETYRGAVAAWECDQYGHMNVQFYMGRISDAAASVGMEAGFGMAMLQRERLGIVAVHQELDYHRELKAGDLIRMESAIRSIEGRKIRIHHRLFNAETGDLAMTADVLGLCFHLDQRKSVAFPEALRDGFAAMTLTGTEPLAPQAIPVLPDGFLPTGRAPVSEWECDRMGHMNVQFYLGRAGDADKQVLAALGLGPSLLRREGLTLRPFRYRTIFKREQHVGAVITVRSGVRSVEASRLALYHELRDAETGTLAATVESLVGLEQPGDGQAVPLPQEAAARARSLAAQLVAPPPPGAAGDPLPPKNAVAGMYETARGSVDRWECDEHGRMAPRFYMARFSEAAGNMLAGGDMDTRTMREDGIGSAALDYTIDVVRPLRVGDAYNNRTGLLELREKTWRFCHVLTDSNTNETVARAEVVAVLFDLEKRKAIVMPERVRAAFAKRLILPQAAE